VSALWWCLRYEALMAARRKVVWAAVLPLTLLSLLLAVSSPAVTGQGDPATTVAAAGVLVTTFGSLGVGLAVADRLRRSVESRGMPELLSATPSTPLSRAAGSLTGPLLTAFLPVAALFLLYALVLALSEGTAAPLNAAVVALFVAVVPAALLATALAGLLGVLLPLAAARAVLAVVWLWACHFPPAFSPIPTATGTVLSPLGGYPLAAWAGAPKIWAARQGGGALRPTVTDTTALVNLVLVLATALACFALGYLVTRIRRIGAS
jgi:ABC-2 type transport system permease protein